MFERCCAYCNQPMLNCYSSRKYHDECSKILNRERAKERARIRRADGLAAILPKPHREPKPTPAKSKPLKGEYREQAFYPLVTVTQPKAALTYNQIKQLADAKGVTYAEQAKVMGL